MSDTTTSSEPAESTAAYQLVLDTARVLVKERHDMGRYRRLKLEVLAVVEQQRAGTLTGQDALAKIQALCTYALRP